MILAIRTDKPEAEIYLYETNGSKIASHAWQAHRELSNTLLIEVENLILNNNATLEDIEGIVVFQGPGSFTGLRIGITVANTLAYSIDSPIVGGVGNNWFQDGLKALAAKSSGYSQAVSPEYGSPAHITKPRK